MNLSLSEEQLLIKSSAEKFFSEKLTFEKRNQILNNNNNLNNIFFLKEFIDLGWFALPFNDKFGGLKGSITDIMSLIEVFGASLHIDPYIFSLLFPGKLIESFCDEEKKTNLLKKLIEGELLLSFCFSEPNMRFNNLKINSKVNIRDNKYYITGKKNLIIGGEKADFLIVPVSDENKNIYLFLLNNKDKRLVSQCYSMIDDYNALDCEFDNLELSENDLLVKVAYNEYISKIEYITDYIILACCTDALGVIDKMYDLTLEYTKTREQFGNKISSFQVVQHRLVDMYICKEEMRSLNYMAQVSFDNFNEIERKKNISLNKIFLGSKAKNIAQDCIQLHGGMGVAEEMQIGHYFKRLTSLCSLLGDINFHYKRYQENDKF